MAGLGLRSGNAATLSTMVLAESIRRQGKYLGGLAGRRRLEGEATRSVVLGTLLPSEARVSRVFLPRTQDTEQPWVLFGVGSKATNIAAGRGPRAEGRSRGRPAVAALGSPRAEGHSQEQTGSRTRFSRTRGERTPPSCAHSTLHFKGVPTFWGTQLHSSRSRMESGLEALSSSPRGTSGVFLSVFFNPLFL